MTDHKKTYVRIKCERCGAPLSKEKQRGKFICPYCGAIYHDRSYSQSEWEEFDIESNQEKPSQPPVINPITSEKAKPPKKAIPFLILVITAFLCLIALVVIILNGSNLTSLLARKTKINKPEMLSSLPAAERAGVAVFYADWELTLSPEISVRDSKIGFLITVKNWDDSKQTFRYQPNDIIVYDDQGTIYPLVIGRCEPDLPYQDRQLTFGSYEDVKFRSTDYWCTEANSLPEFFGVIPQNVSKIYLHLKKFEVFENITFVIDL